MTRAPNHPAIRESVARLCADFPGAYWRDLDRARAYPEEFVRALTAAGFLAALIPEEYGGAGLPLSAAAAILEEIHRAGCNAAACHAQMYTMGALLHHGNAAQKEKYLPAIARGELRLQAFGVTEPGSGSDTTSLRTVARRDGEHYTVTGQKVWTSRAEHSDLMLLLCRTTPRAEVAKKTDGLTVLLVDLRDAPAAQLSIKPLRTMMNHAATEVFFDGLTVPVANRVGDEGRGFGYLLAGLNAERILIAAECIGDAKWFISKATDYAKQRRVFDRPIGQNQGVQFPIARAYADTRAAELMLHEAARLYELFALGDGDSSGGGQGGDGDSRGGGPGEESNLAKLLASEASWRAAEACMETHGGYAFAEEFDIERKYREARLYRTAPVSTNMILSYLAEHILDLPRSY